MGAVTQATRRIVQCLDVGVRRRTLGRVVEGLTGGRALHEAGALLEHQLDVDASADLDGSIVTPCGVGVGPGIHAERPGSGNVRGNPGLVAVEARRDVDHAGTRVFTSVRAQQDGFGGECVVSFAEHGRTNGERLAFGRLSGKCAVLDDGEHFDDRDTGQQFLAHMSNTNLWTDQGIGEDHTPGCDRSPKRVVCAQSVVRVANKVGAAPE